MKKDTGMNKKGLGSHYIAEYHNCNSELLDSREYLEEIMLQAVKLSGAVIIKPVFHAFSPQGVSGVIVIAESHCSIHTWPEYGYAAVDLFSCGDFDCMATFQHIRHGLEAGDMSLAVIERGMLHGALTVPSPLVTKDLM